MSLTEMLNKKSFKGFATAISAIPATKSGGSGETVARIATVAVANSYNETAESKTVAEIARIAVASRQIEKANTTNEPSHQTAEIWVICWTPIGEAFSVKAKNPAHAEKLKQWNPRPLGAQVPQNNEVSPITDRLINETDNPVRCEACQHAKKTDHGALVTCAKGRQRLGGCSSWWALDTHLCNEFKAAKP